MKTAAFADPFAHSQGSVQNTKTARRPAETARRHSFSKKTLLRLRRSLIGPHASSVTSSRAFPRPSIEVWAPHRTRVSRRRETVPCTVPCWVDARASTGRRFSHLFL